jgi:hypothetical protein
MVAEAGFDLKIRVTEFATSLKAAEDGDYELYLIGWERPHRSGRQLLCPSRLRRAQNNGK